MPYGDIIVIAEKVDVCEPPTKKQKLVIEKKVDECTDVWLYTQYILLVTDANFYSSQSHRAVHAKCKI